jgi:phosphohistidine phosphatase SixA
MRDLILLRHAHAEPASAGQDDRQRGLSDTGQAEARAAGDWLAEHGATPGRVLCSPAQRTLMTAREALAALPPCPVLYAPEI